MSFEYRNWNFSEDSDFPVDTENILNDYSCNIILQKNDCRDDKKRR